MRGLQATFQKNPLLFPGEVSACSKGRAQDDTVSSLVVETSAWDVSDSMRTDVVSVWSVASTMWDVTASMCPVAASVSAAHTLCGMLQVACRL